VSRPRRGWSEAEVDEYVKAAAMRRADARAADQRAHPERYVLVLDPEWGDVFGPEWQEVREG
jgi:predicted Zn-dependent protease